MAFCLVGGSYSSKYLHEFHLKKNELVQGAFCGKDYVQLVKLTMYYPRFMPNDAQQRGLIYELSSEEPASENKEEEARPDSSPVES